ncbi:hypothetical protein CALCODRAFT_134054 [Calocera cornea HHB12733]|uniref:Uncharacterized protein n=1 Tax=Calocera cornea HHB12733 TaxID=1353952 RepID=A0A165CVM2_9BASI|nr:hypothetical protein CALCODRAFT_134054 [Calocera cornea HHB12733]
MTYPHFQPHTPPTYPLPTSGSGSGRTSLSSPNQPSSCTNIGPVRLLVRCSADRALRLQHCGRAHRRVLLGSSPLRPISSAHQYSCTVHVESSGNKTGQDRTGQDSEECMQPPAVWVCRSHPRCARSLAHYLYHAAESFRRAVHAPSPREAVFCELPRHSERLPRKIRGVAHWHSARAVWIESTGIPERVKLCTVHSNQRPSSFRSVGPVPPLHPLSVHTPRRAFLTRRNEQNLWTGPLQQWIAQSPTPRGFRSRSRSPHRSSLSYHPYHRYRPASPHSKQSMAA